MADLETEIKVTADVSGVESGVGRAKKSLADLGASASKLGQDGGKGLTAIGDAAGLAAGRMDAATRNIQGQLQRTIAAFEAGEKGSRKYFESIASQRGANLDALRPQLDQLDALRRKTDEAAKAQERLNDLKTFAAAAAGAAALAVSLRAISFTEVVRGIIETGDALSKLSQRTGIAIEDLQQLRYAADLSGVSSESLTTAFRKLNTNLSEALAGNKEKVAVFQALGVSLRDAGGAAISADKAMAQIAEKFAAAGDGAGKTALAVAAFGKAGDELIPLLNGGADGLAKMREEFTALRGAMSGETARAAEQFNDNLTRLKVSSEELARSVTEKMLPGLVQITDVMVEQAKRGGNLLAVWAGLREFAAIGLNADEFGQKIRAQKRAGDALQVESGKLDLLLQAQKNGGDSQGLRDEIAKVRAEVERLQKEALAATAAVKGVLNPSFDIGLSYQQLEERRLARIPKPQLTAPSTTSGSDAAAAYEALIKRVRERIALQDQELKAGRPLTEQEKFETKLLADLAEAKGKITAAQAEEIKQAAEASKQKALQLQERAQELANAKQIAQQVITEQQELAAFEKARADQRDRINAAALEQRNALEDNNKLLQAEAGLIGATDAQRQEALGRLRIELQLKRDIDKINQDMLLTEDARTKAIADKNALAELAKQQVTVRAQIDEFQRVWQSVDSAAQDAFTNIFEGGRDVFKRLTDTLKSTLLSLLYQMTVRPFVLNVVANVTGTSSAVAQAAAGQSGLLGNLTSGAGNFLGIGGSIGSTLASASYAAAVPGLTSFGAGSQAAMLAAQTGEFGLAGLGATASAGGAGALGSALSAIAPAAPYIAAAVAIASLLSGSFKGETRSGGQYVNGKLVSGPSGGEINGDASRAAVAATQDSVNAFLKALGSSQSVANFAAGLESSKEGKGFAYAGLQLNTGQVVGQGIDGYGFQNRRGNKSQEQAAADFADELKQVQLEAIAASDAVGPLADYVRSLGDISQLTGKSLDDAIGRVTTALAQKQQLEDRLFDLTATDSEKLARTRDRERASIDESNRALLERVYALEDEKTAAQQAAEAAQKLKDAAGVAFQGLQRSVDAQRKAIQAAYDATVKAVQPQIDAVSKSLDKISGLANLLDGTLSRYRTDEVTGIGRADANAQIQTAIAIAKASGTLPDANSLQDALAVISAPSEQLYSTLQEYLTARDQEAATIGDLQGLTKGQLTVQERTLNTLKDQLKVAEDVRDEQTAYLDQVLADGQAQLDALNGVNTSVLSVKDAILALNVALAAAGGGRVNIGGPAASFYASNPQANAPDPQGLAFWNDYAARNGTEAAKAEFDRTVDYLRNQHATGLWEVPYDGYRNTAHKGEAILPMPMAEAWRQQVMGGSSSELAARIDVLIERMEAVADKLDAGNADTSLMSTILRGTVEGALSLKTTT